MSSALVVAFVVPILTRACCEAASRWHGLTIIALTTAARPERTLQVDLMTMMTWQVGSGHQA